MSTKKATYNPYTYPVFTEAESIAAGHADDMLRWLVNESWHEDETGTVDHPFGYVVLLNVSRPVVRAYATAKGDPWVTDSRNFTPGWYLIQVTNLGLYYGHAYDSEAKAKSDMISLQRFNEQFDAEV